ESAFYVTFVWWPYYIWRTAAFGAKGWPGIGRILKHAILLGLIAAGLIVAFGTGYYALFGVLPTVEGVLVYVLHPPGSIPFDFHAGFIYFVAVMILIVSCIVIQIRRGIFSDRRRYSKT